MIVGFRDKDCAMGTNNIVNFDLNEEIPIRICSLSLNKYYASDYLGVVADSVEDECDHSRIQNEIAGATWMRQGTVGETLSDFSS